MRIKNTLSNDHSGFELDMASIAMRSASSSNIKLPYNGPLPEALCPNEGVYICANVQLVQGASLILEVCHKTGKPQRMLLEATNVEIIALLEPLFAQKPGKTGSGLSPYWHGIWQAYYIEWEKIASQPRRLLEVIMALPDDAKRYLQEHMFEIKTPTPFLFGPF